MSASLAMVFAVWILLLFNSADAYCHHQDLSNAESLLQNTRFDGCPLQESTRSAGSARNLRAECKQNTGINGSFFYNISWTHQEERNTPVTKYRVYIIYKTSREHACFQVPSSDRHFLFNQSMGLVYGCMFYFSITPQPISLVDDLSQTFMGYAPACPVEIKLLPLPNIRVPLESKFSFIASFKAEPVPEAKIVWFFSPDKTSCLNQERLEEDKHGVQLLRNNLILRIVKVERHHIGCYVVTADNGVGTLQQQRGYLDINATSLMGHKSNQSYLKEIEGAIFASIAAILVVLLVAAIVLIKKWKRSKIPSVELEKMLKQSTVYISHCMNKDSDKAILLELVSALKSHGVEVIIDICSIVDINNVGGITKWITTNIKTADKILIIINPRYLIEMQDIQDNCTNTSDKQKVQFELNIIKKILDKDTRDASVFMVCHGLKVEELPQDLPLRNANSIHILDPFELSSSVNFEFLINMLKG